MKSGVSAGMITAQTAIKAMDWDLMNHPLAVFDVLITTSILHWLQFATFIRE